MTDKPEDTGQISVAELLKRNGGQMESRGGRRRRGAKGGISVAELTGEIPVIRDEASNRNLVEPPAPTAAAAPSAPPAPVTPPAAPAETPAPATPTSIPAADRSVPAPTPAPAKREEASSPATETWGGFLGGSSASAPSASASSTSASSTSRANQYVDDYDDEDDDEPIASRPQYRGRAASASERSASAPSASSTSRANRYVDDYDDEDDDEPIASRPQFRGQGASASPRAASAPSWSGSSTSGTDQYDDEDDDEPIASRPQFRARDTGRSAGAERSPQPERSAQRPVQPEPSLLSGSGPGRDLIHRGRSSEQVPSAASPVPDETDAEKTEITSASGRRAASPLGRAASRAAAKAEAARSKLSLRDRLTAFRTKSDEYDEDDEPMVAPSTTAVGSAAATRTVGTDKVDDEDVRETRSPAKDSASDTGPDRVERDRSDQEPYDQELHDSGPHDAESDDSEPDSPSSVHEWAVLIGQGVVAVIAGALMFKGFEKLWDSLPWVALILALLVIVGLVAMVRILRRTDDITSFVIAVVVGMIVTMGPLAFMLASG